MSRLGGKKDRPESGAQLHFPAGAVPYTTMKKILASMTMVIIAGGALAYGSTGAFFSDQETSTNNTFEAGSFDLKIDSTQHYAGLICAGGVWVVENEQNGTTRPDLVGDPCGGTWEAKDLDPQLDKFFNFTDVKPGDQGENTISFFTENDRYTCVDFSNVVQNDVTQTEPESDEDANGLVSGELGQHLDIVVWADTGIGDNAGNNIWDIGEPEFPQFDTMPLTDTTLKLSDSTTLPSPGGVTRYIGFGWCAGTFTASGPGITPVCDGTSMGNEAQTDTYSVDITFRSVQARNNGDFLCLPPDEEEVIGQD